MSSSDSKESLNEFQKFKIKQDEYDLMFVGAKLNKEFDSEKIDELLDKSDKKWQNSEYWNLKENVRHAVDIANLKRVTNTRFYDKLQNLNDKILIFR